MPKVDIYKQLYTLATKHFDVDPQNVLNDLIAYHLNIKPKQLTKQDLAELLDWLEITAYLIIDNSRVAKDFIDKVTKLAEED